MHYESVAWSRDGRIIVFRGRAKTEKQNSLFIMNIDTSEVQSIPGTGEADFNPKLSPDGRQIVFARASQTPAGPERHLYIIDVDGSNLRPLTQSGFFPTPTPLPTETPTQPPPKGYPTGYAPTPIVANTALNDEPDWSPDGKQIVFTLYMGTDRGARHRKSLIYVINVDGSGLRPLTDGRDFEQQPAWSPDGKRIAYVSNRESIFEPDRQVYVVDVDGSNPVQVSDVSGDTAGLYPSWSPDSRFIVFVAGGSYHQLLVVHVDGFGQIRPRTAFQSGFPVRAAWMPS